MNWRACHDFQGNIPKIRKFHPYLYSFFDSKLPAPKNAVVKVVKEEVGGTGESKNYSTVLETSVVVKGKESQEVIFDDKR